MSDQIERSCICFNCGADCFVVTWSIKEGLKGKAEVLWKCSKCGRLFFTRENVNAISPAASEVPESYDLILDEE